MAIRKIKNAGIITCHKIGRIFVILLLFVFYGLAILQKAYFCYSRNLLHISVLWTRPGKDVCLYALFYIDIAMSVQAEPGLSTLQCFC